MVIIQDNRLRTKGRQVECTNFECDVEARSVWNGGAGTDMAAGPVVIRAEELGA